MDIYPRAGTSRSSPSLTPSMHSLLARLVELESDIAYRVEPDHGGDAFVFEPGRIPIILSAPHGAAHQRNGILKDEDEYTAGLVRLVAGLTGAHALYAHRKSGMDPNYDQDVPYKQALKAITARHNIKFVMDLHGCSEQKEFGLALGTMKNSSCPHHRPLILKTLAEHGFSESSLGFHQLNLDRAFSASGKNGGETVTRFSAESLGIPAAQLEINAYLRIVKRFLSSNTATPFTGKPDLILNTIHTLAALVKALNQSENLTRTD